MPVDGVAVARPLVAEQGAALRHQRLLGRQLPLVVVPDLVAEVAEHRPVRLAEADPQRLAVEVERLGEVDRDDPVGVPDDHALAAAAGDEVEPEPALALVVRDDGQAEVQQLDEQPPLGDGRLGELLQGDGVVAVGAAAGEPAREAAGALVALAEQPVAPPVPLGAPQPALAVDVDAAIDHGQERQRRVVEPERACRTVRTSGSPGTRRTRTPDNRSPTPQPCGTIAAA